MKFTLHYCIKFWVCRGKGLRDQWNVCERTSTSHRYEGREEFPGRHLVLANWRVIMLQNKQPSWHNLEKSVALQQMTWDPSNRGDEDDGRESRVGVLWERLYNSFNDALVWYKSISIKFWCKRKKVNGSDVFEWIDYEISSLLEYPQVCNVIKGL